MLKRILLVALAVLLCLSLLSGCGQKKIQETATEAVVVSQSGNYEFHGTSKGMAWISPVGSDERLLEGSIKVREENSAITITFNGDIMDVVGDPVWVTFTYPVNGTDETFAIHRRKLMDALQCEGVILNTAAGGTGIGAGLLFWNNGTVQTMVLKIQSTHNYSYSPEEGLKIETTPEQEATFGRLWLESYDEAAGVYTIGYDLTVPMPAFLPNPGTFEVTDEQLQAVFGDDAVYTPTEPSASDETASDASAESSASEEEAPDASEEAPASDETAQDASEEAPASDETAQDASDETAQDASEEAPVPEEEAAD